MDEYILLGLNINGAIEDASDSQVNVGNACFHAKRLGEKDKAQKLELCWNKLEEVIKILNTIK